MRALLISLCCLLFVVPVLAQDDVVCPPGEPTLTIASGAVGQELDVLNQQLEQYTSQCPNVTVDVLEARSSVSDRIGLYQQFLDAGSNAVDIYAVDVIWAAIVADSMVDMRRYAGPTVLNAAFRHAQSKITPWTASWWRCRGSWIPACCITGQTC